MAGVVVVLLLAVIAVGVVVQPLLPGRAPAQPAPAVTDADIERAVRVLRQARSRDGLHCPTCGGAYQAGDLFCVRCGLSLAQSETASEGLDCPSCGASIREDDRFCGKCGQSVSAGEVA